MKKYEKNFTNLLVIILIVSLAIYAQEDLRNIDIKELFSDTSLTPEERLDNLNIHSTKGGYYDHERDIPHYDMSQEKKS